MRDLKIQEAQRLLKKILNHPKNYDLKVSHSEISGKDDEVSFKFHKVEEKIVFEVHIDGFTFQNKTGEWKNAMIMLESTIKKIEREEEESKINEALNKLKRYLSTE